MILLALCPLAVNLFSATMVHAEANGSLLRMLSLLAQSEDPLSILFPRPTIRATTYLALFVLMQLILLCTVPGKVFAGPRAPSGHVPTYRENGLPCFVCTLVAVAMVVAAGWCPATLIYDELQPLMTLLSSTALTASVCLYIKGLKCPSTADSGSSGNIFIDLYWGTELYPRVGGVDLKQFVICRLGMVLWCLFAVSFAAKTIELAPDGRLSHPQLVSTSLMCAYIAKFFYWERWYLHAADIQVGSPLSWCDSLFVLCTSVPWHAGGSLRVHAVLGHALLHAPGAHAAEPVPRAPPGPPPGSERAPWLRGGHAMRSTCFAVGHRHSHDACATTSSSPQWPVTMSLLVVRVPRRLSSGWPWAT